MNDKVYGYVTERIVKALEAGTIPWRRPWFGTNQAPRSLVSGKLYRGINSLLLSCMSFEHPYFLTAKQAFARGGKVEKGKGNMVVFFTKWEIPNSRDADGKPKRIPIMRYYQVWNVADTTGIDFPKPEVNPNPINPIEAAEALWSNWEDRPVIIIGQRACYSTASDQITMPDRQRFTSAAEYYSTLYHEGIHATGSANRIGRDLTGSFGTGSYSREELVAEVGAAMLCGIVGIENSTIENSAAYCQSWISRLKGDSHLIVKAAAAAQKAADYIQGLTETESQIETEETVTA